MKPLLRFGALAVLFGLLTILAAPGGGFRETRTVEGSAADDLNNFTVRVNDPSGGLNHDFIVSPGACVDDTLTLDHGEEGTVSCATDGPWTVTVEPATARELASIECFDLDFGENLVLRQSIVTDFDSLNAGGTYGFAMNDHEDIECVFTFKLSEEEPNGTDGGVNDGADPLDQDGDGIIEYVAIAVVADPNVVPCGGTVNLTATARAKDTGFVVPPSLLAFHWETNVGLLNVGPPNTAEATDNHATLTLFPGMTSATVRAWVGDASANPGTVTVQQFCPGVTVENEQSQAPGAISLSASSNTAYCGEAIFVGARVRDSKNQVVQNETVVSFLASAGEFQTGAGLETTYNTGAEDPTKNGTLNTVTQYNAATVAGVLNVTFIAPLINGDVAITAASGDKFAKMVIKVTCGTATTAGAGQAACTPIGDGVCIRPPNTGQRITPPSTGSAGLK